MYHYDLSANIGLSGLTTSFAYGLRMDASISAYFSFLPFLLSGWLGHARILFFLKIYTLSVLFIYLGIVIADLDLYSSWKYRMEFSAVEYLRHYKEAAASMQSSPIVILLLLWLMLWMVGRYIYRWVEQSPKDSKIGNIKKWAVSMFSALILILPMRGGLGIAPLNPGAVYYSNIPFANHCAVNVVWNFLYSAFHHNQQKNPYAVFTETELNNHWKRLTPQANNHPIILLKNKQPNVLFIVWESFTAKVVDQKHNGVEITPNFNHLKTQGIYFSNAYASGDRTEKGIAAVISGYPAQPTTSIVKESAKAAKLPSIASVLKSKKYHTALYYGGDLEFANMKAYLWSAGFNKLISKNDFPTSLSTTKWGVHDHHVFDYYLKENKAEPFFNVLLTLSSHEPFDVPMDIAIKGEDAESRFLNALHYTDQCLGNFIDGASTQPWWNNTLIVIVADHGHRLPYKEKRCADFHIPILYTGGAIDTSVVIHQTVSQIDIVSHVLSSLDMDHSSFIFSKDYDPTNAWAYFAFNNGLGFVSNDCHILYDNQSHKTIESDSCSADVLDKGKAFLQKSFDHYLHCHER